MTPFLDALCGRDLSQIVKSGTPTTKEIEDAWIVFLIQYYELRGDNVNTVEHIRLKRDIDRTKNHLFILDNCVRFLQVRWSDSIADSVRRLGYSFMPESHIPEEYEEELNRVVQESKTHYIELQQYIKQFAAEIEKLEDIKPDRETFERNLLEFEEMQRTAYSFDTMTVNKYLQLSKKHNRYVENLNARNQKR